MDRTQARKPREVIEPTSAQRERVSQLPTRAVEFLRQGGDSFLATRADAVVNWSRKYSMFLYPFVTACCGMEFMSVAGPRYDLDRFGCALPRFSPRQADLLMVVGTITHRQAPILKKVYAQMAEPKWVMAFGACTCSGGPVQQLRDRPGDRHHHSGRHLHPGLSTAPRGRDGGLDEAPGPDTGREGPGRRPTSRNRRSRTPRRREAHRLIGRAPGASTLGKNRLPLAFWASAGCVHLGRESPAARLRENDLHCARVGGRGVG